MDHRAINIAEKLTKISEQWSPKIVAQINDYHFNLVKLQGEFVWHSHADTDEMFMVLEGEMSIQLRDGDVKLRRGEMHLVPKGVEHKLVAEMDACSVRFDDFRCSLRFDASSPDRF